MYLAFNKHQIVVGVSDNPIEIANCTMKHFPHLSKEDATKLLGRTMELPLKPINELKVACICNWNDACGISTYTRFLIDEITKKVSEVRIFSEQNAKPTHPDDHRVVRCWNRGFSMKDTIQQILDWTPDFVIVQHEFGIFPKANYFLQMLQMLENTRYIITLHSVYEHLDKTICTSAIKNIVVHSEQGKDCLRRLGHNQPIFVLPHGCVKFDDNAELWNIFQVPYVLIQFGFGFFYKGVDRAIDAINILKNSDPKFQDIFYVYLCSDSGHFDGVHNQYYSFLMDKIEELDLHDNVSIIRKFHSEETINNYLRTAKIALFPYMTDPKHTVYGASGAIRVAMANGIPVLASESKMFDDLEGIIPRPNSAEALAQEIDHIFSSEKYKNQIKDKTDNYIDNNTWDVVADKYLDIYSQL